MRTDVKLGIAASMALVLTVGGYFLFRGGGESPVRVGDEAGAMTPIAAAKPDPAKTTPTNRARSVTSNRDPATRPNPAVNSPSNRTASTPPSSNRPVDRPANPTVPTVTPSIIPDRTAGLAPTNQPVAPTVLSPSNIATDPKSDGLATGESRPAGSTLTTGSPSGAPTPTIPSNLGFNAVPTNPPATGADLATAPTPTSAERVMNAPLTGSTFSPPPTSPSAITTKPEASRAAVDTHKVQPGDSLATLAQSYYGNSKYAKFLAESNPQINDPARLSIGATIKVPALPSDIDTRLAGATALKNSKTAEAAKADKSGKRTYKVQSGDSFYRIAREQLGNPGRWKELLALNKTVVHGDPTQLQVGQTLVLPES